MTNLERIKNMNAEELAHILGCEQCIFYHNRDCADHHAMDLCREGIEHWLESEVEDNGG